MCIDDKCPFTVAIAYELFNMSLSNEKTNGCKPNILQVKSLPPPANLMWRPSEMVPSPSGVRMNGW